MEIQNPFQISWDKTTAQSFHDYFFAKISAHGSNLAIVDVDTGKQWRYSEIRNWCEMCATRLKELQVTSNSRVAVITGTTGQAIFVHLACSIIGCSAVVVNGWSAVDEIWTLVDLSEATHLIVENQFMQKADDVRRKAQMRGGGRIKHVRQIEDVLTAERINVDSARKRNLGAVLAEDISDLTSPVSEISGQSKEMNGDVDSGGQDGDDVQTPVQPLSGQNPMLILFTSGTTGLAKVVQAKERFLLPLSIAHIFGVVSAYYALINGASLYLISKQSNKLLMDTLVSNQINVMHITPAFVHWMATEAMVDDYKAPHLRSVLCAGAPIDSNLANTMKCRLNIKDFRQSFGMTELGGICTMSPYQDDKIESVGNPLPGMLFKVVNWETKQLCPPRQPGQIIVLGPQVAPCYYKNPKATSELFDATGFVKTGDAGFYDEVGRIYVLDRIKDIIKCKGTLICPSEVELVLRAHPGIDDCAVVGRQDHVTGEVPAAFVVKNSAHPLLASAEVRQYVSGKIATFKELRGGVFFISEIPRSVCGKILRRNLRQFWDRERTNSKVDSLTNKEGAKTAGVSKGAPVKKTNGSSTPSKRPPSAGRPPKK
ncbi:hypothetical protein GCK72_024225 [Caenorhabditis remanei]|uniref:Uncharacterized protein n=1 Tax=Caenorhabditis remanei TaxID=31234 RepID=A0A6A5FZK2_CAERE|nr:hypothetical protein GCK72_024225 [Caenorhabditis remanei]KAF1747759.1 hypothetical protein GCK72_024225 [Caenorhabditis remanei]